MLTSMKFTRTAGEQQLRDLVERPPQAHLVFVRAGRAEALPVTAARDGEAWLIRAPEVVPAGRAMLLIDDGIAWFDLRGLRYPGRIEPPAPGEAHQRFVPERAIGWDYGSLRPVEGP